MHQTAYFIHTRRRIEAWNWNWRHQKSHRLVIRSWRWPSSLAFVVLINSVLIGSTLGWFFMSALNATAAFLRTEALARSGWVLLQLKWMSERMLRPTWTCGLTIPHQPVPTIWLLRIKLDVRSRFDRHSHYSESFTDVCRHKVLSPYAPRKHEMLVFFPSIHISKPRFRGEESVGGMETGLLRILSTTLFKLSAEV